MNPNINSGLGLLISGQLSGSLSTGRFYVVCASADPNYGEVNGMYGDITYPDGTAVVFSTIALAVAATRTGAGDLVLVVPGHAESITSSTTLVITQNNVQIIGLGIGAQRPVVTFTTANTATIGIQGAGISFKNIVFVANFLAIASAFTLTAAKDFQLLNCEFRDTSAILDFLFIVTTDTTSNDADGLTIDTCMVNSLTAAGANGLVSFKGTNDRCRISNNWYASVSTNSAAIIPIATGKILTNFRLVNNHFNIANATGTATGYIITTNGSTNTGFIDGNIDHALPTSPLFCTASSGFVYGLNYHSDTADLQGYLVPAADS